MVYDAIHYDSDCYGKQILSAVENFFTELPDWNLPRNFRNSPR